MSNSVTDSSAASWHAQALAAAESYAQEQADAAQDARDQAQRNAESGYGGSYHQDGVEPPSAQQRALDAFLGPDAARGGTDAGITPTSGSESTKGRTYLDPTDAEQHRQYGFTVLTDEQGRDYLPPQDGYDESIVAPPLTNLPAPDRLGSPTTSSQDGPQPTQPGSGQRPENPPGGVPDPQDGGVPEPMGSKRLFSGAGPEVDDILNRSPSLRRLWEEAQAAHWQIEYRNDGKGSHADRVNKVVSIDWKSIGAGGDPAAKLASLLSHEMGHAGTPYAGEARVEGATRDEYVHRNTQRELAHEGAAAFINARTRDEILASGGPDIEIRGGFDEEYTRIYDQYKAGNISQEEAISRMTYFMALEPQAVEAGRYLTKQEVLERQYNGEWDQREAN